MTEQQQQQQNIDDWEEWNSSSKTTFVQHCLAGSMAGVAEHLLVYPLDTVKTHLQCSSCFQQQDQQQNSWTTKSARTPQKTTWTTLKSLILRTNNNSPSAALATTSATGTTTTTTTFIRQFDPTRLWRGVQTILIGCIPAHALYFSSYEAVKYAFTDSTTHEVSSMGAMLAGAAAVFGHDVIMTPLDTMKQRLQLGHYNGVMQCAKYIFKEGSGYGAFYRSFPITLITNVPYGMIMVQVNEWTKQEMRKNSTNYYFDELSVTTTSLMASSFGGAIAAGITTPLDRIKTVLQTQQLQPSSCPGTTCPKIKMSTLTASLEWKDAMTKIWKVEGFGGYFRGFIPRILSHTPAVAISWTTYETAKQTLLKYNVG